MEFLLDPLYVRLDPLYVMLDPLYSDVLYQTTCILLSVFASLHTRTSRHLHLSLIGQSTCSCDQIWDNKNLNLLNILVTTALYFL